MASLSPGTGAQFSLLPPENATGNWVKVVQRVPVRLQLDQTELDGVTLHAGLSVDGHGRYAAPAPPVRSRHGCTSRAALRPARPPASAGVPLHRGMITGTVMVASILQALDNTIANVALPRMQGSLSATQDQMTWVLTSYIVAAAIMTPLTGWLADRFGRKPLFLVSIIGFTLASALCGLGAVARSDRVFRVLQGCLWRRADPDVAGGTVRRLSARTARPRHGDLGHRRGARPYAGSHARRLAHRQLQLALGVLHQRAVRHHGGGSACWRTSPTPRIERKSFDFFGFSVLSIGGRRAADIARSRTQPGLVQCHRDQGRSAASARWRFICSSPTR